jgi:hypothetical protein
MAASTAGMSRDNRFQQGLFPYSEDETGMAPRDKPARDKGLDHRKKLPRSNWHR